MSCNLSQLLSASRDAMNIVKILLFFVALFDLIQGFCVPQERNHVLLHDGDHLNDEIFNFSIQTRKSDNCDQNLWIKFFIEWKWKYNDENFDLLSAEMKTFQAAFSSYFNALFQKFRKNPIELILESVDVNMFNNAEKPKEFTEIRTLFKCKSTLPIVSKFLEQDCDDMMRILLEKFQVRQFFVYFQDESVSSEVYYDYFESETARDDNLSSKEDWMTKISISFKFDDPTEEYSTTQIPQTHQTRHILQDQLEEIYDEVKNDDTTDHLTRDFYIKNVIPIKNDELSFFIVAEILFPWIDPKNLSDRDSRNYQKLLKDFAEYSEKLYAANPLALNSKIKCKVDEIIDSFEKIGQHFIAIPNAFIVNFHLQPIGLEIDIENVKLLNGNIFDKIFENFKSEELFKAYERDDDDEYYVDRDGFIFDNSIEPDEEKFKSSWSGDYEEYVDDETEYFEIPQSSSLVHTQIEVSSLDISNSSPHPVTTKNVINTDKNLNVQDNHVTVSPMKNKNQENSKPIIKIEGVELKVQKSDHSFTCTDCIIFIYPNFGMTILNKDDEDSLEDEEEEIVDYSEYDYSSLEKLDHFINFTSEFDDYDSVEILNEAIDSMEESKESFEDLKIEETENLFKKFDPKDPMWKNIIPSKSSDKEDDYVATKDINDLAIENYSEEGTLSTQETVEIFLPHSNHKDSSSGEILTLENINAYQNDAVAFQTLTHNENYVMINKSEKVKCQMIFTLILLVFVMIF